MSFYKKNKLIVLIPLVFIFLLGAYNFKQRMEDEKIKTAQDEIVLEKEEDRKEDLIRTAELPASLEKEAALADEILLWIDNALIDSRSRQRSLISSEPIADVELEEEEYLTTYADNYEEDWTEEVWVEEEETYYEEEYDEETEEISYSVEGSYTLSDLQYHGVINWQGNRYTYYSQQVLPGGGLDIPGRHVNAGGFVSDGDGYIVLANDVLDRGTVVSTPFGYYGKIYDRFGTGKPVNHYDVYTQ